nr:(2Fe-2S)-binding protein [Nitrospirillum iridis]
MDAEAAALAADPVRAEVARRSRPVCVCKNVNLGTIEDAVRSHALATVAEVKSHTNATGGCGACAVRVEEILAAGPALVAAE